MVVNLPLELLVNNNADRMDWKILTEESQLKEIIETSAVRPQVIFKHSTRCSISSLAKNRLDRASNPEDMDFYFLDLISFRSLSDKTADLFMVNHESPQVLVIRNGECIYDESHISISMDGIVEVLNSDN
jgi:bacillithiol system protein YtxJ